MYSSREVVTRAIRFQGIDRLPRQFPAPFPDDFAMLAPNPDLDSHPHDGRDEWGSVWKGFENTMLGQVKEFPLKTWADLDHLTIPDPEDPKRWQGLEEFCDANREKFLQGHGVSIYERVHFLRGLENTWADIHEAPDQLRRLIDILVDMNLSVIRRYQKLGVNGFFMGDDWGLQNRLMIAPESWRQIWKPAYARIFAAAHEAGMLTTLHSCGHIVAILDDLIEIGLDMIHMDQQQNMGLELLGERFGGRITFFSPVDIQKGMQGTLDEIRAYARRMVRVLGRPAGGFIPRRYSDPKGAGHRPEAVTAMFEEFLKLSREMYGA